MNKAAIADRNSEGRPNERRNNMATTKLNSAIDSASVPVGEVVTPLVSQIVRMTGLDENQAKTVVYYATATHALTELQVCPVLILYGPAGTGKSTILEILNQLVYQPRKEDGKKTRANLRDTLEFCTTALIDEADKLYEGWLTNRYSKRQGSVSFKQKVQVGWEKEKRDIFGATVLHRRVPFKDPAIQSRSITISTRYQASGVEPFREEAFGDCARKLAAIAKKVEWQALQASQGNRIPDTWAPLVAVAETLGDEEWLDFAKGELEKGLADLQTGHQEEPSQAVFRAFLSLSLPEDEAVPLADPKERVALAGLTQKLKEQGLRLNSWQTGKLLRDMGFETKTTGGTQYVYTGGAEKLRETGRRLGVQDEWIDGKEIADKAA